MKSTTREGRASTIDFGGVLSAASLYEANGNKIHRYILSMVRDRDEADDLTQETFLRVHRGLEALRDRDAVVAWVYRVASRVCYDRFRQFSNRPILETFNPGASEPARMPWVGRRGSEIGQGDGTRRNESLRAGVLDDLPHDYRTAIILHDLEGIPNPEIAEMLGISVDAVKIHVYRARRKLQVALSSDCDLYFDEQGIFVCEPKSR